MDGLVSRSVQVSQVVKVTVDEAKFTPEFMAEFQRDFFPLQTVDDHIEHLAQMYARGVISDFPGDFIEGYGPAKDMGIAFAEEPYSVEPEIVAAP